jgi:spore maturation protein A
MCGAVAMWSGFMKIAEKSGLVDLMAEKMKPVLKMLFPSIPVKSKAMKYIAINMAANFFGLGWAATPSGISAVKELDKINKFSPRASNAVCMFMVINMSSIQLISMNIISYRLKYESLNPMAVVLPGIIATTVSTVTAVIACKLLEGKEK